MSPIFSSFRKNEKHAILISAIRAYMRIDGYYERLFLENSASELAAKENCPESVRAINPGGKDKNFESDEYREAENAFSLMFPQCGDGEDGNNDRED